MEEVMVGPVGTPIIFITAAVAAARGVIQVMVGLALLTTPAQQQQPPEVAARVAVVQRCWQRMK
jgi:hypothetical protein